MTIRRITTIIAGFLAMTMLAVSCNDEAIEVNDAFITSKTYAEQASNTPLQLSTIRLDSVLSSSQNIIWVGKAKKPVLGNLHSNSYIRLAEPVRPGAGDGYGWLQKNKEIYDSVTVSLRHTGAFVGDTMAPYHIRVRCLSKLIEFADDIDKVNGFYNVRSFPEDSILGEYFFKPRPNTHPRLRFRLNDTFGKNFRDFIIYTATLKQDIVTQKFQEYMKGIKIESCDDVVDTKCMLAFRADSFKITLHSHVRGLESIKVERQLMLYGGQYQFNEVWNTDIEAPFDKFTNRFQQITEDEADHKSLIFEGLGYYTRVNIPTIEDLYNKSRYAHVVKAILKIYPQVGTYDKRRIPQTFSLFELNKGNVVQDQIVDSRHSPVRGQLVYNLYDRSQMYYTVDITYYVNTLLSRHDFDVNGGMLMTWGGGMNPTNYDFMVFNGHGVQLRRSELEITYYNYDIENR